MAATPLLDQYDEVADYLDKLGISRNYNGRDTTLLDRIYLLMETIHEHDETEELLAFMFSDDWRPPWRTPKA